jgi:hypothetical protein
MTRKKFEKHMFTLYALERANKNIGTFETFLLDHLYSKYTSAVKIAGDYGQALSKIGDLERELGREKL